MKTSKYILHLVSSAVAITALAACSNKNNAHTTVITQIPPPAQQVLKVINKPVPPSQVSTVTFDSTADPTKPLIVFHLQNGRSFRVGEEVPIEFSMMNAKLRGDGGDFRVRYMVDDDDMKWLDKADPFWLAGWIPGKHTIRIELIGPDGWPYENGNANIVTREISITPS